MLSISHISILAVFVLMCIICDNELIKFNSYHSNDIISHTNNLATISRSWIKY